MTTWSHSTWNKWLPNRPHSICQYSSMTPRLLGQISIFGVVFFVSKSPLGIEGQKKLEKFAILPRKPRSRAWILIYRAWPITGPNSFSFFTVRDYIDLSPKISNVRGNDVTDLMACGFLQPVSNTWDACLENVESKAGLSGDRSPMPKCFSIKLKTKFWITGVNIRADHINQRWMVGDSMNLEKRSRSRALLLFLFIVTLCDNTREAGVLWFLKLAGYWSTIRAQSTHAITKMHVSAKWIKIREKKDLLTR